MEINFLVLLGAALVPMIIGFFWYNPKFFGNAWMLSAGMTENKMKGGKMGVIFGLSFLLSFFLAIALYFVVIHQSHIFSILAEEPGLSDPGSELNLWLESFNTKYGSNFRTFKHGVFHGVLDGFFFATPVLATNALFERKGFKYIAINCGYWIVTLGLMGGIISQWA
ncbi:MAG: hypothetical protein ACJAY8_000323 [Sphingobacteriales bacterium]|jgi:hypothetical protein